jgi:hypothetical protein
MNDIHINVPIFDGHEYHPIKIYLILSSHIIVVPWKYP